MVYRSDSCPRCGAKLDRVEHQVTTKSGLNRKIGKASCSSAECGASPKASGFLFDGVCWEIQCQGTTKQGARCTKRFTTDDPKLVLCTRHGGITPALVVGKLSRAIRDAGESLKTRQPGGNFTPEEIEAEARRIAPEAFDQDERLGHA